MTRGEWRQRLSPSKQARYQHKHQALGLCRLCPSPLAPGSIAHCVAHVLRFRARARTRTKGKAWRPGGPGRPPLVLP